MWRQAGDHTITVGKELLEPQGRDCSSRFETNDNLDDIAKVSPSMEMQVLSIEVGRETWM